MSRFEIVEIGEELDAGAGIPEGCELCGHCTFMRNTLAAAGLRPCGGGPLESAPAERPVAGSITASVPTPTDRS